MVGIFFQVVLSMLIFVERCCVGVGVPGVNLLAGVVVLRRDDFQVFGMAFIRPWYIVNGHCKQNFPLNPVRDKKLKSAVTDHGCG